MGFFKFCKPKPKAPKFGGGEGSSLETAVVINANSSITGVRAEYEYLTQQHGQRGADWDLDSQSLMTHGGKYYDVLNITLRKGGKRSYYFDISRFFGKII